jgi:N-acetylmuramoyl-L-alanine amidase
MIKGKKIICLTLIALMAFGFFLYPTQTVEAKSPQRLLKVGCRGTDVSEVQKLLSNLGVRVGPIDGIFGSQTRLGVIVFQKYNKLAPDGIVGPLTYSALLLHNGQTTSAKSTSATTVSRGGARLDQREMYLLAQTISSEAKGEPYEGQVAVGAVILNRVKSPKFPNTIAGVVYQKGQFEPVMNGTIYQSPSPSAVKAAQDAVNGWDPSAGALYFYNPQKSTSAWIFTRPIITRIGNHVFTK